MDRGIDVVRNKIKSFAQRKVTLPPGRHKIIILDEADSWVFPGSYPPILPFLNNPFTTPLLPLYYPFTNERLKTLLGKETL